MAFPDYKWSAMRAAVANTRPDLLPELDEMRERSDDQIIVFMRRNFPVRDGWAHVMRDGVDVLVQVAETREAARRE